MQACGAANLAKGLAVAAAWLWCSVAISASATTYVFDQTSSSVPGFVVAASLSISGGLADLPTISNIGNPGPYNFSPLSAFDITLPSLVGEGHYILADFSPPQGFPPEFPQWSISSNGIDYINATDTSDFIIKGFGALSTIEFESDGPTNPSACESTGVCIATGQWDPVSAAEPAGATLLLAGLLGSALARRKRKWSVRPSREPTIR
jgi:hypothetical protein